MLNSIITFPQNKLYLNIVHLKIAITKLFILWQALQLCSYIFIEKNMMK